MSRKKSKRLDDMLINYNHLDKHSEVDMIDERSTLCIKNGTPTNYSYNKEHPNYPYCKSSLNCVYKEYAEDKYHCRYFLEKKK